MEAIVKMSLQYQDAKGEDRAHFISRGQSYHGATGFALALSGHKARVEPYERLIKTENFHKVSSCFDYLQRDDRTIETFVSEKKRELDQKFRDIGEGKVAAFVCEPIVGAVSIPSSFENHVFLFCTMSCSYHLRFGQQTSVTQHKRSLHAGETRSLGLNMHTLIRLTIADHEIGPRMCSCRQRLSSCDAGSLPCARCFVRSRRNHVRHGACWDTPARLPSSCGRPSRYPSYRKSARGRPHACFCDAYQPEDCRCFGRE